MTTGTTAIRNHGVTYAGIAVDNITNVSICSRALIICGINTSPAINLVGINP